MHFYDMIMKNTQRWFIFSWNSIWITLYLKIKREKSGCCSRVGKKLNTRDLLSWNFFCKWSFYINPVKHGMKIVEFDLKTLPDFTFFPWKLWQKIGSTLSLSSRRIWQAFKSTGNWFINFFHQILCLSLLH